MKSPQKMKVLHLTSHLNIGGITRYIELLGGTMARRGHEMAVVSAGGELAGEYERNDIKSHVFAVRKKSVIDPSLYAALPNIAKLIRQEKYDVMHAHTRVTQALAYFLRRQTGVPTVSTYHGFFRDNFGRKFFPFFGDRNIAISEPVAQELKSLHRAPESGIRVVPNAIDWKDCQARYSRQDPTAVRKTYGIPEDAVVISSVGRLVQDKGHEILIRALAELLPAYPELFLLMVGDGKEKEHLEKVIRELGLGQRARLVPGVRDVSAILKVTDIFAHPAFYREGFGLGIAEAMAVEKPVVITDIPAVNTLFKPGQCSVMAKPADVLSLAGAIRFLLEVPAEKARVAAGGQQLIQFLCDPERMADQMEAVYRELVPS